MAGCRTPGVFCPTTSASPDTNTFCPVASPLPELLGAKNWSQPEMMCRVTPLPLKIDSDGMLNDARVTQERHKNIERGELKTVRGIIVHQTGGASAESSLNSYRDKNANGAHFLIDKDGTIYQTASLFRQTWHVGKLRSRCVAEHTCSPADMAALKVFSPTREHNREMEKSVPERYPANVDAIGIELVGMPNASGVYETASDQQNLALKWLVDNLLNAFRVSAEEVFRHPTVSRKTESEAASARW